MSSSLTTDNYKLITIVGPTSSGKSELAVSLAKKFNGEIISADSRQIYRGMDLGTGKIPGRWITSNFSGRTNSEYFYKGIRHHCIDYISPRAQYSAARFVRDAKKALGGIMKRGKLPIICGGTGHWIDALVYNQNLPDVKPNKKLREELEKLPADVLFGRLTKLDPARASTIDKFNKRRLIRALEIVMATGKPVPQILNHKSSILNPLWLGIKTEQDNLYKKIEKRLKQRLRTGMIKEVRSQNQKGVSWKRLESFGLEYRYTALYLQNKITYEEMFSQLLYAIKHYSKRQLTWWKRNKEIKWIDPKIQKASGLVKKFLK